MKTLFSMRWEPHRDGTQSLEHTYVDYFSKQGFSPIILPCTETLDKSLIDSLGIERVVLTGGNDIDAALYNETDTDGIEVNRFRDNFEMSLINWCIQRDVPLLGVCRGMQILNVHAGGSMHQEIKGLVSQHCEVGEHDIEVTADHYHELKPFAKTTVNSFHHQAVTINRLGKDITPFALCGEIVEGLFHNKHRLAGVEWHPERHEKEHPLDALIVKAFHDETLFWKPRP